MLLVLAGGAHGSGARYLVGVWMVQRFGPAFPWGTFAVNVGGSFLVGLIAALADEAGHIGPEARIFLVVGVLGGFTTFSSFSLETLRLAERGDLIRAIANVLVSLAMGVGAALLGVVAGRALDRS